MPVASAFNTTYSDAGSSYIAHASKLLGQIKDLKLRTRRWATKAGEDQTKTDPEIRLYFNHYKDKIEGANREISPKDEMLGLTTLKNICEHAHAIDMSLITKLGDRISAADLEKAAKNISEQVKNRIKAKRKDISEETRIKLEAKNDRYAAKLSKNLKRGEAEQNHYANRPTNRRIHQQPQEQDGPYQRCLDAYLQ